MSEQAAAAGAAGGTIMVPLDGSPLAEAALPVARALLPPDGRGELALTTIVADPDVSATSLAPAVRDEAAQALTAEADRLGGEGVRVRVVVGAGDPAAEIVRLASEEGVELIAMATHGRGALGRWAYGSVADRVARAATVPVLLVRPEEGDGGTAGRRDPDRAGFGTAIRRLLVPLDGSELAEDALPVAERYTRRLGAPVVLVRVINPVTQLPSVYGAGAFPSSWEVNDEIIKVEEEEAAAYLAGVAKRLEDAGLTVERRVGLGTVAGRIESLVQPGDAIVMTSHGRSGVGRWVLGSVAEKLVRGAPAPVLLVPAAGRETGRRVDG